MAPRVESPPALTGQTQHQLQSLYAYLYRLSELLNVALADTESAETRAALREKERDTSEGKLYEELKALIVNTSDTVNHTIDGLQSLTAEQLRALSEDWGVFQENITQTITETAGSVVSSYGYDAALETLRQAAAGFDAYRVKTEGFIRQGFIDTDEDGMPVVGIAIGQGLKSQSVEIDGKTYEQFDTTQSCAFYTAGRVSFRINGQEVAYLSNRKMYIGDVEITGTFTLGPWLLTHENGLTLKWIG